MISYKKTLDSLLHSRIKIPDLANDPLIFPRRYKNKKDIETAALISSAFAYGNVKTIINNLARIFLVMGKSPYNYINSTPYKKQLKDFAGFKHRFHNAYDLVKLNILISEIYRKFDTLEEACTPGPGSAGEPAVEALKQFHGRINKILSTGHPGKIKSSPYFNHLLPDIHNGSACKRQFLFLRWMIRRQKNLDTGIWKILTPAELIIPLDVHVLRISGFIGLTASRTANLKTALGITRQLRQLNPADPLVYDFPLSHLGISGDCRSKYVEDICLKCPLKKLCKICIEKKQLTTAMNYKYHTTMKKKIITTLMTLLLVSAPMAVSATVVVFSAVGAAAAAGIIGGIFVSQTLAKEFDDRSNVFGLFTLYSTSDKVPEKSTKFIECKSTDGKVFYLDRFPLISYKNIKRVRLKNQEGNNVELVLIPGRRGKRHIRDVLNTNRSRKAVAVVYESRVVGLLSGVPGTPGQITIKAKLNKDELKKVFELISSRNFSKRSTAF